MCNPDSSLSDIRNVTGFDKIIYQYGWYCQVTQKMYSHRVLLSLLLVCCYSLQISGNPISPAEPDNTGDPPADPPILVEPPVPEALPADPPAVPEETVDPPADPVDPPINEETQKPQPDLSKLSSAADWYSGFVHSQLPSSVNCTVPYIMSHLCGAHQRLLFAENGDNNGNDNDGSGNGNTNGNHNKADSSNGNNNGNG